MTLKKYLFEVDFGEGDHEESFYLAADAEALLDDPQALAAYIVDRQKVQR